MATPALGTLTNNLANAERLQEEIPEAVPCTFKLVFQIALLALAFAVVTVELTYLIQPWEI